MKYSAPVAELLDIEITSVILSSAAAETTISGCGCDLDGCPNKLPDF